MKKLAKYIAFGLLLVFTTKVQAQVKYPVTANSFITNPNPVYLSDYAAAGNNAWNNILIFNDFNEISWDVRLRVTISSNKLRLRTKENFTPANPITLYPGVAYNISPSELYEYLLPQNLEISGNGAEVFLSSGRLPEGFYNFCIEALDYNSGQPLSVIACASTWIQLKEPPLNTMPLCDGFVPVSETQNITFQWQPAMVSPVENVMVEYYLRIHEVTDLSADPKMALTNGMAMQVFESPPLLQSTYHYSLADYVLEPGKVYIYQVQAVDVNGKNVFKNNGFGEPCVFYYGYPEGATIALKKPATGHQFTNQEIKSFRWTSPDRKIKNQPFNYELKIMKINPDQDSVQAVEENKAAYLHQPVKTFSVSEYQRNVEEEDYKFEPGSKYAWKVIARSGNQLVAESEIRTFTGPSVIDFFYAKGYLVNVKSVSNGDLDNFAGSCRVKLGDEILEGDFDSLQIVMLGDRPVLETGEIIFKEGKMEPIALAPEYAVNDSAYFYGNKLKLNKEGFFVRGYLEWPLLLPVDAPEPGNVMTKTNWFTYFDKELGGGAELNNHNNFTLIDPYGFKINLDTTSLITVYKNTYDLILNGNIELPESINYEKQDLSLSFFEVNNLDYLKGNQIRNQINFPLVENTGINVISREVTIDLSDQQSPANHQFEPEWKGIYFNRYQVILTDKPDKFNQITSPQEHELYVADPSRSKNKAWVDGQGISFFLDKELSLQKIKCNQFPSLATRFKLDIRSGVVYESWLKGKMIIPFINEENYFHYTTPISISGFNTAYLEELEDHHMTLNPDNPDQELQITFTRAEFNSKNHITATVDLYWPVLDARINKVAGFNIWGNGELGFHIPNGSASLAYQVNSKIKGYAITIDAVGAGRDKNIYSVGTSFKINMSEDISGIDGPPVTQFYTVAKRNSIDSSYMAPSTPMKGGGIWTASGYKLPEELTTKDISQLMQEKISSQIQSKNDEINEASEELGELIVFAEERTEEISITNKENVTDSTSIHRREGLFAKLSEKEARILESIVEGFSDELTRPLRKKIDKIMARSAAKIDSLIKTKIGQGKAFVDAYIDTLVTQTIITASGMVPTENTNSGHILSTLAFSMAKGLKDETSRALYLAVEKEITGPLKTDLSTMIPFRIDSVIRYTTSEMIFASLEGKLNKDFIEQEVVKNTGKVAEEIAVDFFRNYINPEAIANRIRRAAKATLTNISTRRLLEDILSEFTREMSSPENIASMAKDLGMDKLAGSVLKEGTFTNQLVHTGMNFTNLENRSPKDYFSLDPSNIAIHTKWLSLTGATKFYPDDPAFGNIWRSDVSLIIKKPKDIPLKGTYINGKLDDGKDFWFAQVAADDSKVVPGGPIQKKARPVAQPIDLGFVKIMAASVRVYKHMREDGGLSIKPDPTVKNGGYFNFILFDKKEDGGYLRLDLEGELVTDTDGEIQLDFMGDMQLMNKKAEVDKEPESSMANVGILVHYNSREEHFLGQVMANIENKGFCCEGFLEVETKPDYWHVYVGTYEQKIKVTPLCKGWGGLGYLMLDNRTLEAGLGVSLMFQAKEKLNVGIAELGFRVEGYAAAGVTAGLAYRPEVKLLKAGVWLELYAKVMIDYKLKLLIKKKGSITLLELYVAADLMMYFDPPPTYLEGNVKGRIAILSGLVKCKFNAHFKKNL